jgi:AAA+ ATPase superfamily predicted ATPase
MRPKIGKKSTMPNVIALSQKAARGLVNRERRSTGSQMTAYENVARAVGATPEWIRKFVKNNEGKEPGLAVGFNLLSLYSRVCLRVEQATQEERELKGEIDAAFESIALLLESTAGAEKIGA